MDLGAATEPAYRKDLHTLEVAYSNTVQQPGDSLPPSTIHVSALFCEKAFYSGKREVHFHLGITTLP